MREAVVDLSTQPVRNLIRSSRGGPTLWWNTQTPSGSASGAYVADGGPDGLGAYRVIPTSAGQLRINWRTGSDFVPTVPGERWTLFVSIYTNRAVSGMSIETNWLTANTSVSHSWVTSAPFTLNVGWNNIRIEFTTPAGAYFLGIQQLLSPLSAPNAAAVGDEYRATMGALFKGSVSAYADGDSPGWRWTGTPGTSESVGYPWAIDPKIVRQEIRNLAHRQATGAYTAYSGGITVTADTVDRQFTSSPATKVVRADDSDTAYIRSNASAMSILGGNQFTISFWIKSTLPNIRIPRREGGGGVGYTNVTIPIPTGQWTYVTHTWNTSNSAANVRFDIGYETANLPPEGVVFSVQNVMLTVGSNPEPYADGDTPGWTWVGTPGSSPSVGYPYTLESIAGEPLVNMTAPGSVNTGLAPYAPRTLYVVHQVTTLDAAYPTVGRIGSSGSGGISYGGGNTGSASLRFRFDTAGGTVNELFTYSGTRTPGMHVAAATVNDGMTLGRGIVDDRTLQFTTTPLIPGEGMNPTTALSAATVNDAGAALLVYAEEHNEATMRRVLAWLARKYGAPISAGY